MEILPSTQVVESQLLDLIALLLLWILCGLMLGQRSILNLRMFELQIISVRKSWGGGVALGRRRYKRFRCVPNILKMCERKLTEWSQVSFPNGRKKIEALKDKLAQL